MCDKVFRTEGPHSQLCSPLLTTQCSAVLLDRTFQSCLKFRYLQQCLFINFIKLILIKWCSQLDRQTYFQFVLLKNPIIYVLEKKKQEEEIFFCVSQESQFTKKQKFLIVTLCLEIYDKNIHTKMRKKNMSRYRVPAIHCFLQFRQKLTLHIAFKSRGIV